jgi:YidC/Oxa1 family membrane protein insertase
MSKPSPKSQFLQRFILITTIWLGLYLFVLLPGQRSQQELLKTDSTKYFGQLMELGGQGQLKDVSLPSAVKNYSNLLDNELKQTREQDPIRAEQLAQEVESQKLHAHLIAADTALRAGLLRDDANRLRTAYMSLRNWERRHRNTPLWNEQRFRMPEDTRYEWDSWTANELYQRLFTELNNRNRRDLTYGFLPGYQIIDSLVALTGRVPAFSYAFACFLLALIVRIIIYPLSEKQLRHARQMMQLGPLSGEIRTKYKDDPQQMNLKVMELYKEYGINPMAGCFPALLQLPLFLTVYQFMLHYQFEFRNGVFLWINPQTSILTRGWSAPNLGEMDYALILLYGVTMLISTLMAPISDPTQAKQQRFMTIGITVMFTVMMFFWPLPSAFVLYWTFTNILSSFQSLRAYRRPMPQLEKVNAAGGGVYPKKASGPFGGFMERMQSQMEEQMRQKQDGKPSPNGGTKPGSGQIITGEVKKGTPAKHKPKKRK